MLKKIVKLLNTLFSGLGKRLVVATSKDDLLDLISRLRPKLVREGLVRIGNSSDGGYLLPNILNGIDAVYSPGVGSTVDFEKFFLNLGIKCFLADKSIDGPPLKDKNLFFVSKFLGIYDNDETVTLESWVSENVDSDNLILQMDIEGAEWQVLVNAPRKVLSKFRIIVIEFHNLSDLITQSTFSFMQNALLKILMDFHVVHIHPNNSFAAFKYKGIEIPSILEITFVRNDSFNFDKFAEEFPNYLDSSSVPSKPDIYLPKVWYSNQAN